MKKSIFLSLMLSLFAVSVFAQNITVKGTVKDNSNGDPIPSASVLVKGAGAVNGVVADLDGKFSISVPADAVLLVSSIGYETKEVAVNGKSSLTVFLASDSQLLDSAVKVGYGSSKKIGNSVGAIATVKSEIVQNSAAQSPLDLLQGQVAGMQVLSTGGVAGDNSISMKIHGVGSVSTSSEPLFIVDGVQSSSTLVMNMNPNDIQSITVLKDASSTSIYGSLGANGVVYVTTKAGHFAEKATVTVHTQWGLSTLANRQFYENMMSGDELKEFWIRAGLQTEDAIYKKYTSQGFTYNTKWHQYYQKLNGLQCQNDVTIEGGSQKVAYLFSASQFHQDGNSIGNYYDRYTVRTNVQARPVDWLKAGMNIQTYVTKDQSNGNWGNSSENSNYTGGGLSYLNNPLFPAIDPETGKEYPETYPDGGLNPKYYMATQPDVYYRYGLNGSAFVEIELYKGLILSSRVGTDSSIDKRLCYRVPSATWASSSVRILGDYYRTKNTISNTLEYSNVIKAHEFSVLLGQEGVGYKYHANSSSASGFTDDRLMNIGTAIPEDTKISESVSDYSFLSFFGHADYNYQGRYFIDGTVRADASSRFGKDNRWAPFWAVGAMWKISQENFLRNVSQVNDLSLKVSYGTQGNANIGNYEHLGTVAAASTPYFTIIPKAMNHPSNNKLRWEKQALLTVTAAGRFFNRLDAEVSVYNRVTSDMLMTVPQPYTSGFTTLYANVGGMKNTGVDITLGVDILKGKDYFLKFNTTFNYNKEKITELFDGRTHWTIEGTGVGYVVGQPVVYYSPIYAGVDPQDGAPMWYVPGEDPNVPRREYKPLEPGQLDNGSLTKVYSEERLTQNTGIARHEPISGGFGLRGGWKGISVNIDFAYFGGKYLINNDAFFYANPNKFAGDNQSRLANDFWTPYNTNAKYPDWSKGYEMQIGDSHLLENASFLRLKNLTVGYDLPSKILGRQNVLKGLRIYATGRNLWTVTAYEGLDPEVDSNVVLGVPGNTLQVLGGLQLQF